MKDKGHLELYLKKEMYSENKDDSKTFIFKIYNGEEMSLANLHLPNPF